jgi:hydrogenase maturation protease
LTTRPTDNIDTAPSASSRIICLGNELVCDDGVGIRIGRILRMAGLPADVQVELVPNLGFELLELITQSQRLILVDAMRTGREAGQCQLLDLSEVASMASSPYSCHGVGLAEVVYVARQMTGGLSPSSVFVLGIEAPVLDRFGFELSPEVAEAIPEAVERILRLVGVGEPLIESATALARERMHWNPTARDLAGEGWPGR